MKKYEPDYVDDEIAIQGWESAALFVQGVKMAGNNLTQANVIKEDNSLTAFTAGWAHVADQLEERRPHRSRAALLHRVHQGRRGQVRTGAQQGTERVQLLRVDQRRRRTRSSRSRPAPRPRLITAGGDQGEGRRR